MTRKTKDKENAGPEPNAEIEAMEASTETVSQDAGVESIEDIDIEDAGNPQLVVEYVQDIYSYLRYESFYLPLNVFIINFPK